MSINDWSNQKKMIAIGVFLLVVLAAWLVFGNTPTPDVLAPPTL